VQEPINVCEVKTFVVARLREELTKRGLSTNGKKVELCGRLVVQMEAEAQIRRDLEMEMDASASVEDLNSNHDDSDQPMVFSTTCQSFLLGLQTTVQRLYDVFANHLTTMLKSTWVGYDTVHATFANLSKLSEAASNIHSHIASKNTADLVQWGAEFASKLQTTLDVLEAIPHQLNHKPNHVEFTDGGGGVGSGYFSVQLQMVLWLLLTGGRSISRFHNAARDSKSMFAEQTVGALNALITPDSADLQSGAHRFAALGPKDLVGLSPEGWQKLSTAEVAQKLKDCYGRCHGMAGMLKNKKVFNSLLQSAVFQDPSNCKSEYPPVLPDWYGSLFYSYTLGSCTKTSRESSPLHLHLTTLQEFLHAHSLEVPKVSLQVSTSLCRNDEGTEICCYPPHTRGEFGSGLSIPLFSHPVVGHFDEQADKMRYLDMNAQQLATPSPQQQHIEVPHQIIKAGFKENVLHWYDEFWDHIKIGPTVRTDLHWKQVKETEWVTTELNRLTSKVGPNRATVKAAIAYEMLLKSHVAKLPSITRKQATDMVLPDLGAWTDVVASLPEVEPPSRTDLPLWASEQLEVVSKACFCDLDHVFSLILGVVEDSKQRAVPIRSRKRGCAGNKKRRRQPSRSDLDDKAIDQESGEDTDRKTDGEIDDDQDDLEQQEHAEESESQEESAEEETDEEPAESEILSFIVAAGHPLALLRDFANKEIVLGAHEKFPRTCSVAASFLASKDVKYRTFWLFARKWEQQKTNEEGDKLAGKLLGRPCCVQHEKYKMGFVQVRKKPPPPRVFEDFPRVVLHGHVACYELKAEASACQDTLEWDISPNLFVSGDGKDLENFAGAVKHWEDSRSDVYIFYQVLKPT
jgi:hypothetical protein